MVSQVIVVIKVILLIILMILVTILLRVIILVVVIFAILVIMVMTSTRLQGGNYHKYGLQGDPRDYIADHGGHIGHSDHTY